MKTTLLLMALALITLIQPLEAKTLIVSDVDDTVKMTDVLGSGKGKVFNALFKSKSFAGMSELYQSMVKDDSVIYYVSGAPTVLTSWVKFFLKINKFPQPNHYILKAKLKQSTLEYKVQMITAVIAKENPSEVILIGDDTECDHLAYKQISEENPGLVKAIYIHSVKNLQVAGVTSYFTSVEIAAHEILENRLDTEVLNNVTKEFLDQKYRSGVALTKRFCPKEGSAGIESLKEKFSDAKTIELLDSTQNKIIRSCQ